MKNADDELKKLSISLGRLAPSGTWFREVLEDIYHSDSIEEAQGIADYASSVFRKIGIIDKLWVGDREINSEIKTKYLKEGDIWVGYQKDAGVSVLGKTEEDAIKGVKEAIKTHERRTR